LINVDQVLAKTFLRFLEMMMQKKVIQIL